MNKIVSHGLAGLIGGAIGATVSFFITKAVTKKKYEAMYHAALDKAYEAHKTAKVKESETPKEPVKTEEPKAPAEVVSAKSDLNKTITEFGERFDMIRKKYARTTDTPEAKTPEELDENVIENIREEAYYNEDDPEYRADYDHVDILWYEGDDTMCYEKNDEEIHDIEKFIGYGHLKFVDDMCTIRNHKLKADYSIVRNDGYYSEEVLGIDPAFRDEEVD